MQGGKSMRNFISIQDLSRQDILDLLVLAKELKSWNSTSVGVSSKIEETILPIRTAPAV